MPEPTTTSSEQQQQQEVPAETTPETPASHSWQTNWENTETQTWQRPHNSSESMQMVADADGGTKLTQMVADEDGGAPPSDNPEGPSDNLIAENGQSQGLFTSALAILGIPVTQGCNQL